MGGPDWAEVKVLDQHCVPISRLLVNVAPHLFVGSFKPEGLDIPDVEGVPAHGGEAQVQVGDVAEVVGELAGFGRVVAGRAVAHDPPVAWEVDLAPAMSVVETGPASARGS
jgi:hypothetical protein